MRREKKYAYRDTSTNLEPISLRPTLLFDSSKNIAISALHSAEGRRGGEGKGRKGVKGTVRREWKEIRWEEIR